MTTCYIGLGSNMGNRKHNIKLAIDKINLVKKTKVTKLSSIIQTLPVGGPKQNKFLNAAAEIRTGLSPRLLISNLQRIEKELGRIRARRNGPRTIDLDILLFGNRKIKQKGLIIPHPRMQKRDFVLKPLSEIIAV